MSFKKIIFFISFVCLVFLILSPSATAKAPAKTAIYFFENETCPHCLKGKEFLESLKSKYPNLEIKFLDIAKKENQELFKKLASAFKIRAGFIPTTFIGDFEPIVGFQSSQTTGKIIEKRIQFCLEKGCPDPKEKLKEEESKKSEEIRVVKLPLFGEIEIRKIGLFGLASLIGIVDGFNACAMWSLCFLLGFLVASKIRKRVFYIGGTFILVSGIVHFAFVTVWLNIFQFLGFEDLTRILVAGFAIIFGLVCIKDFFFFGKGIFFITPKRVKPSLLARMKAVSRPEISLPLVLLGVAGLAFLVNLVELASTTGFPVVFTKILNFYKLSTWQYYFYLFVYIFFYILDDSILFAIAITTLRIGKFTEKHTRVLKLISGVIILILGLILAFRPEILIFG